MCACECVYVCICITGLVKLACNKHSHNMLVTVSTDSTILESKPVVYVKNLRKEHFGLVMPLLRRHLRAITHI